MLPRSADHASLCLLALAFLMEQRMRECSKSNLTKVYGWPAEGEGPGGEADGNLKQPFSMRSPVFGLEGE